MIFWLVPEGLTQDGAVLLMLPVGASVLLLGPAVILYRRMHSARDAVTLPLSEIAATRGLWWIIGLGSICVAAQHLLLAFLPMLEVERGVSPMVIGVLLSIGAAMASRLLFGRAVRRVWMAWRCWCCRCRYGR